jgi:hypothetical protein
MQLPAVLAAAFAVLLTVLAVLEPVLFALSELAAAVLVAAAAVPAVIVIAAIAAQLAFGFLELNDGTALCNAVSMAQLVVQPWNSTPTLQRQFTLDEGYDVVVKCSQL